MAQIPTCRTEADLGQVGVWREADCSLEQADELESREADMLGEVLQPQFGVVFRLHAVDGAREQYAIAGRRLYPVPAAAVPLEELAERPDQKFAFEENVAPFLDGVMHRQEARDQIRIAEHVAREIGHRFDPEARSDLIERGLGKVHRAILPALAPAHPSCVRLGRIEDEQRRRMRLLDLAAAADHRSALLRYG